MDDKLHFGIAGGSGDFKHEGVESNVRGAVPTANRSWWPVNKLETFDQGTNVVDGYEGEDGNDGYGDEEEEASQADDESTRNVEDWGHSRFDRGTSLLTGMSARMATMRMCVRREKHRKPMTDQRRMWKTQGIVLESAKIRLYISDL